MKKTFDVTFRNGSIRIAFAQNIDAYDKYGAVLPAIEAIAKRREYYRKSADDRAMLEALHKHLQFPKLYPKPDGIEVFVARVDLGDQVI